MKNLTDLEYLQLSKWNKFTYKLGKFFVGIPTWFKNLFVAIGRFFVKLGKWIAFQFTDIWQTFKNGDWKTRLSFLVMGFGNASRGQWLRGLLFFAFEFLAYFYKLLNKEIHVVKPRYDAVLYDPAL